MTRQPQPAPSAALTVSARDRVSASPLAGTKATPREQLGRDQGVRAPLDDPAIWATRVTAQAGDLMLVGHLPHLAKLARLLLAGDSDRLVIGFRQGGLVSLEDGPARWSVWLIVAPAAV